MRITDDYLDEGLNRIPAGTGVWPVREIVEAMPAAVPIDVETPLTTLKDQGVPPLERVRMAVDGARSVVDSVTPSR